MKTLVLLTFAVFFQIMENTQCVGPYCSEVGITINFNLNDSSLTIVKPKKGLVLEIYQQFGSIKSIDILKKIVPSLKEVK